MIDTGLTGLRRSDRLADQPKQKYGIFAKFSLAVIVACKLAENLHTFPLIENQDLQ